MIKVNWRTGTPPEPDFYLVAVEMGEYLGTYDLAAWDGERWEHDHPDDIIGFISFAEFKTKLQLNWPKETPPLPEVKRPVGYEAEWKELTSEGDAE